MNAKLTSRIGERSATVFPMFTTRVHRPPHPRGHRAFILEKREWR